MKAIIWAYYTINDETVALGRGNYCSLASADMISKRLAKILNGGRERNVNEYGNQPYRLIADYIQDLFNDGELDGQINIHFTNHEDSDTIFNEMDINVRDIINLSRSL